MEPCVKPGIASPGPSRSPFDCTEPETALVSLNLIVATSGNPRAAEVMHEVVRRFHGARADCVRLWVWIRWEQARNEPISYAVRALRAPDGRTLSILGEAHLKLAHAKRIGQPGGAMTDPLRVTRRYCSLADLSLPYVLRRCSP